MNELRLILSGPGPIDATKAALAADVREIGPLAIVLVCVGALFIAPVLYGALVERKPDIGQWTATLCAASAVALLALATMLIEGSEHGAWLAFAAFAVGCASYKLGPLLGPLLDRWLKRKSGG